MELIRNFPFFSIIIAMFSGIVSSVLSGKMARRINLAMISIVIILSGATLWYTEQLGESITYMMGHFPAPWGNEIRFGVLECLLALFFAVIMLLSILGGQAHTQEDVEDTKLNLFYVLLDLMMSSLLALIYTNDLFTGYVFVEINTIAACGMIMMKQNGHGIVAAIRYMVMAQIGSGLFLIGICILYGVTGQLLMVPANEAVAGLVQSGQYAVPLVVIIALIAVGLGIKSGLYPFHSWIPDTYGYATPTASAILSGLVSKGYIFLLIKIICRVIGFEVTANSKILNVLFVLGVVAMILGSVYAIMQKDMRKMIAYSSVAQIGYIYMGLGLGTTAGLVAAIFHILTHAATKALLFVSASELYDVSGGNTDFKSLRGAGYRSRMAGCAFSVGALAMVGFPMLAGFISKYLFATAAMGNPDKLYVTAAALIISTFLNAAYFLKTMVTLYSERKVYEKEFNLQESVKSVSRSSLMTRAALLLFVLVNVFLGSFSSILVDAIQRGLAMFVG